MTSASPVDEHDLARVVFGLPHRGSGTEAIRVAVSVAVRASLTTTRDGLGILLNRLSLGILRSG
jgi:hypothetical protein